MKLRYNFQYRRHEIYRKSNKNTQFDVSTCCQVFIFCEYHFLTIVYSSDDVNSWVKFKVRVDFVTFILFQGQSKTHLQISDWTHRFTYSSEASIKCDE